MKLLKRIFEKLLYAWIGNDFDEYYLKMKEAAPYERDKCQHYTPLTQAKKQK
jgi:hypothetical protein